MITIGAPITNITDYLAEKHTKLTYPVLAKFAGTSDNFCLLGTGARLITWFKFHTYAMGIYTTENDLKNIKLVDFKEESDKISYLVHKTSKIGLKLKSARSTNGNHLRNAFTKMLSDRSKSQGFSSENEDAIKRFGTAFPKSTMLVGSEIDIVKIGKDCVKCYYLGELTAEIQSEWLATNLVGAYLDRENPLIEDLKSQVLEAFNS